MITIPRRPSFGTRSICFVSLVAFMSCFFYTLLALTKYRVSFRKTRARYRNLHNFLYTAEDTTPILEGSEWNVLLDAKRNQVMSFLREKQISLLCGTQITNAISSIKHDWSFIFRELRVWPDGQAFVVTEVAIVMEDQIPAIVIIDRFAWLCFYIVGHNLDLRSIFPNQMIQECSDDGLHARRENDDWNVVRERPCQVLFEVRIKLDILYQKIDAFVIWSCHGLHHPRKRFTN